MLSEVAPVIMYKDGKITEYWDMPHDWQDSFIKSTHDFIDSIKYDREPVLTGERGREVLKFALAAIDSSRLERQVKLDEYEDKPLMKKKSFLSVLLGRKKKK
jgi:predicted dehydrogenase